jgi:hypothetical protein
MPCCLQNWVHYIYSFIFQSQVHIFDIVSSLVCALFSVVPNVPCLLVVIPCVSFHIVPSEPYLAFSCSLFSLSLSLSPFHTAYSEISHVVSDPLERTTWGTEPLVNSHVSGLSWKWTLQLLQSLHPDWQLDCNLMTDPESKPPRKCIPRFLTLQTM